MSEIKRTTNYLQSEWRHSHRVSGTRMQQDRRMEICSLQGGWIPLIQGLGDEPDWSGGDYRSYLQGNM